MRYPHTGVFGATSFRLDQNIDTRPTGVRNRVISFIHNSERIGHPFSDWMVLEDLFLKRPFAIV